MAPKRGLVVQCAGFDHGAHGVEQVLDPLRTVSVDRVPMDHARPRGALRFVLG